MTTAYRFGSLDLLSISDGVLRSSADYVCDVADDELRRICALPDDRSLMIPVNSFFFRRGEARVLIDAGTGNTMQKTLGKLPSNLHDQGIEPDSITHIILTHIHPDHANGLVDDNLEAAFPQASIMVHQWELDFWMQEDDASTSEHVRQRRARNKINLKPYMDRLIMMTDGDSFLGCAPSLAAGHTPGHACWHVETGAAPIMAWGDLIHFSSIQFQRPDIAVRYDLDAPMARETRLTILGRAAAEGTTILGAHVAAPGVGRVVRAGEGFAFVPAVPVGPA